MYQRPLFAALAFLLGAGTAAAGGAAAIDAPTEYLRRTALPAEQRCAQDAPLVLPVDLESEKTQLATTYDAANGRLDILYRMSFNQLTEGWNWHPEIAATGGDYYTYKYLPLASVAEERNHYRSEDKIGSPQEFVVRWRYDYFFAFDNPGEFYRGDAGDDAGFAASVAMAADEAERLIKGDLRMRFEAQLEARCLSDSTTFWKATSARPEDFTLKKRYLIGKLLAVRFEDAATGRVLARLPARQP